MRDTNGCKSTKFIFFQAEDGIRGSVASRGLRDLYKCNVQVTLNNISKKKAVAIKNALEPDNVNFPKGLSFEIKNIDNKLVFNFQSIGDTKKLVATVDEVLEHVKLVSEIIE